MPIRRWSKGDRVVHATRPEWGSGDVLQADGVTHEGRPCQRLVVRFERAGMKTISTAFAELREAAASPFHGVSASATLAPDPPSPHEESMEPIISPKEIADRMTRLPESVMDPFIAARKRCEAAMGLYKLGESPAGLLDWAAVQTGLKDPLTKFNRHELEQWFDRFKIALDNHLRKLLKDARKQEPTLFADLLASASPAGKQALRRIDVDR